VESNTPRIGKQGGGISESSDKIERRKGRAAGASLTVSNEGRQTLAPAREVQEDMSIGGETNSKGVRRAKTCANRVDAEILIAFSSPRGKPIVQKEKKNYQKKPWSGGKRVTTLPPYSWVP